MTAGLPPAATGRPRSAPPALLVLERWETFLGWLLTHTRRWPKNARFTFTQRVENHALDVLEELIEARYTPSSRPRLLRQAHLTLERMRFLFRLAKGNRVMPARAFEVAMRSIDEVGRMLHGWRRTHPSRGRDRRILERRQPPCDE